MALDVDYTKLSLTEVRSGLQDMMRQTQATFGAYDARQVNWRPDATRWSVAQCFEHLLTTGNLIRRAAEVALNGTEPRSIWQRLPILPRVTGRLLIRSLAPHATRKLTAPPTAQPASDISADVIRRFIDRRSQLVEWVQSLDEKSASRAIMTSPFVDVVAYSVLDACRILVAHDRRHFEQACRVTQAPGFPL